MGEVRRRLRLARERARHRRVRARRRWRDMSLRTAFVWYVLIAAVLATIVCALTINLLDEYRLGIYFKYREMSEQVLIPDGGSYDVYVNTNAERVYIVYNSDHQIVERGAVNYGERSVEVGLGDDGRYSLFITPEYSSTDRFWDRVCSVLQAASLPICYLGALIICAVLFWRWRLRDPIVALDRASARIAESDLDFKLVSRRHDELGRLTDSCETMRASLDANSREMWAQMEERRRLNAAFAHDLRTPLTVLKGHADMLAESIPSGGVTPEEAAFEIGVMRSHISRLENYVDAMGRLQRLEDTEIHREWLDAKKFASSLGDSAAIICSGKQVDTVTNGLGAEIHIDPETVMQVCDNILSNATRYAKTRVTLSLWCEETVLAVSVADDGPGFSPEALSKAANPFYKGRESGANHLGLGLNICDILCRRHDGSLEITNSGMGARVTARFGM